MTVVLLTERLPQLSLNVGYDPVLDVEEASIDGRPATEVGDREQLGRRRVVELREDVLQDRPIPRLAEDALRLGAAGEVDESLRCPELPPSLTTAIGSSIRIVWSGTR